MVEIHVPGQMVMVKMPPHARNTDPRTSHAAAAALADKHTMMRTLLLAFATRESMSSEQACRVCGFGPEDGAWKRVSDLKRAGFIAPTGNTTTGSSGRSVELLAITEEGRKQVT
jgi:hypothetical protein